VTTGFALLAADHWTLATGEKNGEPKLPK
jgi:hypothetical protein